MTGQMTNGALWAQRWQLLLQNQGIDTNGDASALRGVRVKRLELTPGRIDAQVQDRELGAATVAICVPVLSDAQWEQVLTALASQALFAAQLLAGEMPPELEQVFAQAGAELLPRGAVITHTCSACPPQPRPCRPVTAVYRQLGEMLAEDPWLLLRLRGRNRQDVLAALHERRNTAAADSAPRTAAQPANPTGGQERAFYMPNLPLRAADDHSAEPLDAHVRDFWGRRKVLEDMHHHLALPAVDVALLRRLGPLTPSSDGQQAFAGLQQVYRRVTDRVWDLAFAADGEDDGSQEA
jgi:uncharacterized Zn finger protein